ncbi:MAG: molybdopterin-dependent oxidoreductase [Planctomycetes bacterium]|nr:molybdopterin-dependent oxidoreductase [Planctomycetota bacterium]
MSDVRLTIDGCEAVVPKGTTIIEAARSVGIEIPHFCYHPGLSVPSSCRMCLVEIEGQAKLVPSCATPVSEGMVVRTNTPRVHESHRSVMEFYLTNHPLDCPVCDQAGECVLQDYSYAWGSPTSRFEETKVTQPVKDVGPDIVLYADRCIMCTRCVRFLREVSGTGELSVVNRGVRSEIHVDPGRPVDNPLAGNIVDICPVGALCSKDFLFKCRVWWLTSTASTCPRCATACTIRVDTAEDRILRIKPRKNAAADNAWICDEGRFTFRQWQGAGRLDVPLVNQENGFTHCRWDEALALAARSLRHVAKRYGPEAIAFIGSPWATIEENMLLAKLFVSLGATAASIWPAPTETSQRFPGFRISAEKAWNVAGARRALLDVAGQLLTLDRLADEIEDGRLRAVYALGGAYRGALVPYEDLGLELLEFFAVQTCFMSDKGLKANLVLPGASPYEKTGTVRSESGSLQDVNAAVPPPGQARRDWDILRALADAMALDVGDELLPAVGHRDGAQWDYTRGASRND